MKHARQDYDRIQDPSGKIGADEPVFLLRAQDMSAPETIRFWADENVRNGGDLALSQLAEKWADNMEAWQRDNRSKPADLGQAASPAPDSAQEVQGGLTELVDALCKESGYTMSAERVRAILARQSALGSEPQADDLEMIESGFREIQAAAKSPYVNELAAELLPRIRSRFAAPQAQVERAAVPEGYVLQPGQILALERRSNMTDDEALRYARCVERLVMLAAAPVAEGKTDLRKQIDHLRARHDQQPFGEVRSAYNAAIDRLDVLASKIAQARDAHKPCTMRMSEGSEVVTVTGASGQQGSTRTVEPDECAANMNGHSYGQHGPNGERQCKWCGEEDSAQVDTPLWDEGGEPANEAAITVERAETLARKLYAEALATDSTIKPVMFGNLTEAERAEWLRKAKFVYPSAQVDAEGGDHG